MGFDSIPRAICSLNRSTQNTHVVVPSNELPRESKTRNHLLMEGETGEEGRSVNCAREMKK